MKRSTCVIAAIVTALGSSIVVPTSAQANVTSQAAVWSATLSDIAPRFLEVSPDGTISGTACASGVDSVVSLSKLDGSETTAIPTTVSQCVIEQAVDANGVVYTIETPNLNGSYGSYDGSYVAAYKDNHQLWVSNLGTCKNSATKIVPQSLEVGYDGGIYVVGTSQEQCSDYNSLIKLDSSSGTVRYDVPLRSTWTDGSWNSRRMTAYEGGLAVADSNTRQLRYFNYDGTERVNDMFTYREMLINHSVRRDGSALMTHLQDSSYPCPEITTSPGPVGARQTSVFWTYAPGISRLSSACRMVNLLTSIALANGVQATTE